MSSVEFIDHPADVGVIITADTKKELFEEAANTMVSIIADIDLIEKDVEKEIEVSDMDLPGLMVSWLEELLFLFEVEDMLFCDFQIQTMDNQSLRAIVRGEMYDSDKHELLSEIKAVTYHELEVSQINDHWKAQIIFDL